MKWRKGNTEGFMRLLKSIMVRFKDKIIDLWIDRAPWHRGEMVEHFRRQHHHVHLHYLPPYHPELNYQETLWRTMRYEETTNAFFETLETLEVSVFKRSQRWKPQRIKSLCPLS